MERNTMQIKQITKKDGSIVYRANVYLGVDKVTGKDVKTSITGRTKKKLSKRQKKLKLLFYKMDLLDSRLQILLPTRN